MSRRRHRDLGQMSPDLGLSSWLDDQRRQVIEQSFEFTHIPWRPVIERQLGREVMGIVQGEAVAWRLGRQPGFPSERSGTGFNR